MSHLLFSYCWCPNSLVESNKCKKLLNYNKIQQHRGPVWSWVSRVSRFFFILFPQIPFFPPFFVLVFCFSLFTFIDFHTSFRLQVVSTHIYTMPIYNMLTEFAILPITWCIEVVQKLLICILVESDEFYNFFWLFLASCVYSGVFLKWHTGG